MNTNIRILILLFSILLSSCQKREWNNPFDPDCPKESWTPTDFVSIQQGNAINLTWVQAEKNISGFRIERKIEGETAWKEVVSPEKATNSWADQNITGGKLYEYRIVALAGGNESNFSTVQIKPLLAATLATAVPSAITATSAILGGTITTDGGVAVTERGICWATTTVPTTGNNKLAISNGTGTFSNTVTGLTANTTYYVRAYAINSQGTAYGNEVIFKTSVVLSIATLTTNAVINYTSNSATLGGNITTDGNALVTERGVCYSTSTNPTTSNTKLAIGSGTGSFSNTVTGLTANTNYYVRAYAINSQGTAYGNEVSFKTSVVLSIAALTTNVVSNYTSNSAALGGNITTDGNATVTERGVCYSTSTNPTTNNSKVAIGSGIGSFSQIITGLAANTTYYVRAYAINSQGTAYGTEQTFKTGLALSTAILTTSTPTGIISSGAMLGGNITSDGNATVTERGICYSTSQNPTTSNTKVTIGSGTGIYSQAVTGLAANTTYYVRAFATNSIGTAYGEQVSVNLYMNVAGPSVTDIDGNVYNTVTIGTQTWMVENLKTTRYNDGTAIPNVTDDTAWKNLETPGYCWYNNDAATYKNTYGALYNWFVVNTGKLAPKGWHVPTDAEWTILTNYLGGESIAGGILKESGTAHWASPNAEATNESGFTALPAGARYGNDTFNYIGIYGNWWSSTYDVISHARSRYMYYEFSNVRRMSISMNYGYSVRCIKD